MNLLNFIIWLSTGAVIGWLASRMVMLEQRRMNKSTPVKDRNPEKS